MVELLTFTMEDPDNPLTFTCFGPAPPGGNGGSGQKPLAESAGGGGVSRKRKRQPVRKACARCRRVKTACSEFRPCGPCKKRGCECVDTEDDAARHEKEKQLVAMVQQNASRQAVTDALSSFGRMAEGVSKSQWRLSDGKLLAHNSIFVSMVQRGAHPLSDGLRCPDVISPAYPDRVLRYYNQLRSGKVLRGSMVQLWMIHGVAVPFRCTITVHMDESGNGVTATMLSAPATAQRGQDRVFELLDIEPARSTVDTDTGAGAGAGAARVEDVTDMPVEEEPHEPRSAPPPPPCATQLSLEQRWREQHRRAPVPPLDQRTECRHHEGPARGSGGGLGYPTAAQLAAHRLPGGAAREVAAHEQRFDRISRRAVAPAALHGFAPPLPQAHASPPLPVRRGSPSAPVLHGAHVASAQQSWPTGRALQGVRVSVLDEYYGHGVSISSAFPSPKHKTLEDDHMEAILLGDDELPPSKRQMTDRHVSPPAERRWSSPVAVPNSFVQPTRSERARVADCSAITPGARVGEGDARLPAKQAALERPPDAAALVGGSADSLWSDSECFGWMGSDAGTVTSTDSVSCSSSSCSSLSPSPPLSPPLSPRMEALLGAAMDGDVDGFLSKDPALPALQSEDELTQLLGLWDRGERSITSVFGDAL